MKKFKVKLNSDLDIVNEIKERLKESGGYCPCVVQHTDDYKCQCKDFIESEQEGECFCGLFEKIAIDT